VSTREQFWTEYYAGVVESGAPWLDYSNDRVQAQTFGLVLEAAGPLRFRTCVDIGCGRGDFCRVLRALHASAVTGVDIVPELIAEHQRTDPEIQWLCGSIDGGVLERIGTYDVAFLLEVLQLMPLEATLHAVWTRVRPGGRLVGMVPNARCPIVSRTRERFAANYAAPSLADIQRVVATLRDVEHAAYRGLSFALDQRVVPYDVGGWREPPHPAREPNRIQFAILKSPVRG
jgi:2-polyprenyl-3-methyl-5-hydroxy-6-metoxy-1,4-benzoquinol methylase